MNNELFGQKCTVFFNSPDFNTLNPFNDIENLKKTFEKEGYIEIGSVAWYEEPTEFDERIFKIISTILEIDIVCKETSVKIGNQIYDFYNLPYEIHVLYSSILSIIKSTCPTIIIYGLDWIHIKYGKNIIPIFIKEFSDKRFIINTSQPIIIGYIKPSIDVKVYKCYSDRLELSKYHYGRNQIDLYWESFGIESRPKDIWEKISNMCEFWDNDQFEECESLLNELEPILGQNDGIIVEYQTSLRLKKELG